MSKNELMMRSVEPGTGMPGVPDRATRVASWIGWHFIEITGVIVPAVVAVSVTPWAWLVSGVVGTGWTVQAVRTARNQEAVKAGRDFPGVTGVSSDVDIENGTEKTGVDVERTGGAR